MSELHESHAHDGPSDLPLVSATLEEKMGEIWQRIQKQPTSYVMAREEFAVFTYFGARYNNAVARQAVSRFWCDFNARQGAINESSKLSASSQPKISFRRAPRDGSRKRRLSISSQPKSSFRMNMYPKEDDDCGSTNRAARDGSRERRLPAMGSGSSALLPVPPDSPKKSQCCQYTTFSRFLPYQREKNGSSRTFFCCHCGALFAKETKRGGHVCSPDISPRLKEGTTAERPAEDFASHDPGSSTNVSANSRFQDAGYQNISVRHDHGSVTDPDNSTDTIHRKAEFRAPPTPLRQIIQMEAFEHLHTARIANSNRETILDWFRNRMESITEDSWDWWPLANPLGLVGPGEVRIEWRCVSLNLLIIYEKHL